MKFKRTSLIRFYDDLGDSDFTDDNRGSHVSAITGMIGEDLLLGTMFHCLANQQSPLMCSLLPDKCKAPGNKGKRLDAWVLIGDTRVAQIEIKNWSAHSLGGKSLPFAATEAEVSAMSNLRWKNFFGNNDRMPETTLKVLQDMPVPIIASERSFERWLCFWLPIAQNGAVPISTATIMGKEVNVFSASIYLRRLREELIDISVPRIDARLKILSSLCVAD